jgi:nitrite reductase/ring-hydroxylating ferredoxin subunit
MTVGGYLGGYLAYSRGVGVNHTFLDEHPQDWTPVLDDADLPEGKPTRVTAVQAPVLLYRSNGTIYAIGARCSHAGGPLEEGAVDVSACTVECPWHHSVFRLGDGGVVHGPASMPQPAYDVRVDGGRIEVRERR